MKNGSDTVTKIVSGIALAALSIPKRDSAILASQTGYPTQIITSGMPIVPM